MNKKELIGREIEGFKFTSPHVPYYVEMDKLIGKIGKITNANPTHVTVEFNGLFGQHLYPTNQIEHYLVPEKEMEGKPKNPIQEAIEMLEAKGYKITKIIPIGTLCMFTDVLEELNENLGCIGKFDGMVGLFFSKNGGSTWKYCKQIKIIDI